MVADWDCIVRKLERVTDGRVKPVKPGHDGVGRVSQAPARNGSGGGSRGTGIGGGGSSIGAGSSGSGTSGG
jgi:hypothetical protein